MHKQGNLQAGTIKPATNVKYCIEHLLMAMPDNSQANVRRILFDIRNCHFYESQSEFMPRPKVRLIGGIWIKIYLKRGYL